MTPERFRKVKAVLDRRQPDLTVIADNFRKSHNVAALVRTCDAVGVYRMYIVSPDGESERHHMVAAGTHKWVNAVIRTDVAAPAEELRAQGFRIVAAHLSEVATDYREIDYTVPIAVVLGSELTGVCRMTAELADQHVKIPMRGMVESLNVSVANALILYEAARQREAAGLYGSSRLDADDYDRILFEWCYPEIAERCREHGVPYPELDEDGCFSKNPLPGAA